MLLVILFFQLFSGDSENIYEIKTSNKITANDIHQRIHSEFWNGNVGGYYFSESIQVARLPDLSYKKEKLFNDSSITWYRHDEINLLTAPDSVYWLKFSLRNKLDHDLSALISFNAWKKIDFYYIDSNKDIIEKKVSGNYLKLSERDVQNRRIPFIKITMHQGSKKDFVVRLVRGGDEFWFDDSNEKITGLLYKEHEILEEEYTLRIIIGLSSGIIVSIILFNLFLVFITHNISALFNAFFLFFWEMFYITTNGIGFEYFWPNSVFFDFHAHSIFVGLCIISFSQFFRYSLNLKETNPGFDKFYKIFAALSLSIFITQFLDMRDWNEVSINVMFTTVLLSGIIINYKSYKSGNKAAKYYLIGIAYTQIFQIFITLSQNGILPYFYGSITNFDLVQYSVSVQVILYSYGLVVTYKASRDEVSNEANKRMILEIEANSIKELERNKSRFFSNISHELRTPLTLIINPLDHFLKKFQKTEYQSLLSPALNSAKKLTRLVNQLLDLARMDENKLSLNIEKSDLVRLLNTIIASYSSYAKSKKINLIHESGLDSLFCDLDFEKIETVLSNLVSNAIKFTHYGEVRIKLEKDGDMIVLSVSDTGIGIANKELERIFDRFYQADQSDIREYEGSGIGLSLVKELVTLHHGSIDVKSELNKGTNFKIRIPYHNEQNIARKEISDQIINEHSDQMNQKPVQKGSLKTILLVEDQKALRDYVKLIITESGFNIIEASNGQKGIDLAKRKFPDLIITDIMMPKMSGIEMIEKLQAHVETSHIPVLILSGKADRFTKIEGLRKGAIDYIAKPFSNDELISKIHTIAKQQEQYKKYLVSVYSSESMSEIENKDEKFLLNIKSFINKHISDLDLSVSRIADELACSESTLLRKVKNITEMSVNELIRETRLDFSRKLLENSQYSVSEACYASGFKSLSYFTKKFKEKYRENPSDLIEKS